MEVIKKKYSNADGEYLDGVSFTMGDKVHFSMNGKKRLFTVTSLGTQTGYVNCYDHHIIFQTCDNKKKFLKFTIHGSSKTKKQTP